MSEFTEAKNRLSGSFGRLQVDGSDIGEVSAVQIQIEVGYTDVQRGMDVGKKMTKRSGSGSFTLQRAYTRMADFVEKVKAGKAPVCRLVAEISDPDAVGGQVERVAISEIELTTLDVMSWTHGEMVSSECPFTFEPGNLNYLDRINA